MVIPEIEVLAEREWERYVTNLALKKISARFSEQAIVVFRMSLDGLDTAEIASKLAMKANTVNQLRKRVRDRLTAEIRLLRSELE